MQAIANRQAELSDATRLANRLDRITDKVLEQLEKTYKDIKPASLPLAAAILIDKASQARGNALASSHGNTTINVQVNGGIQSKESLRELLLGVGQMSKRPSKATRAKSDLVELVSSTPNNMHASSYTHTTICEAAPAPTTTAHNLELSNAALQVPAIEHAVELVPTPGPVHGTPANAPEQEGGRGSALGAGAHDALIHPLL